MPVLTATTRQCRPLRFTTWSATRGHMTVLGRSWRIHRAERGEGFVHLLSRGLMSVTSLDLPSLWFVNLVACLSIRPDRRCGRRNSCQSQVAVMPLGVGHWPLRKNGGGIRRKNRPGSMWLGASQATSPLPYVMGEAAYVVQSRKRHDFRPHISKAEREHTPPALATWLVELARLCAKPSRSAPH